MYKNKRFLAIIPARAGSKRLPKKNVLNLAGKPLIAWSIEASMNSKYIDDTIITSDSDEVLGIAKGYKVKAIQRPDSLALDTSTIYDVVEHALKQVTLSLCDYIVLLQPTSPLRNSFHIDESIELLMNKNADAVISVGEMDHSPLWSNTIEDSLSMENFMDKNITNIRSQDLPVYYRINGAIYICDIKRFLKQKTFFIQKNIYAYKMNKETSIDIDEQIDFKLAELLMG